MKKPEIFFSVHLTPNETEAYEAGIAEGRRLAGSMSESELLQAARDVIAAFDAGVFIRDTSHDNEPGWAVRMLPHLVALGKLVEAVQKAEGAK